MNTRMKYIRCLAALAFVLVLGPPAVHAQVVDEMNTFRLAQTYEQSGRVEDALRYYNDLLGYRPGNPAYFDGVRRCLSALKRYDEVITLLTGRIGKGPADASLLVQRGTAYFRAGNEKQALADWEAAIASSPRNPQIYLAVSDEALDNRLFDQAINVLLRGRQELATPTMFVFELARAYAMAMRYDRAMDEYLRYLIAEPNAQWQVQNHIMQFAEIPEALDAAVRTTERAAARNHDNLPVQQLLSWLYMERKDYVGAAGVARTIDELRHAGGQELLGFATRAWTDNQFAVARDVYRELLKAHPDAAYAAQCMFYAARCTEALADQALLPGELDPRNDDNTYDRALELYREVVAAYPQQPVGYESRHRIGWIFFARKYRDEEALTELRAVAPQMRNVLGRIDSDMLIGDILVAEGKADDALAQYHQVLERAGANGRERGELAFRIAELHYFLGDFENALKELEPLGENSAADIANDALALTSFITRYQPPSDAPLRKYAEAQYLVRQRRIGDAITILRQVMATYDAMPIIDQVCVTLGELCRSNDADADAIAVWEQFLAKYPESPLRDQAMFGLAGIYETMPAGRSKAIELYERILGELPNSLFAQRARERILVLRKSSS